MGQETAQTMLEVGLGLTQILVELGWVSVRNQAKL